MGLELSLSVKMAFEVSLSEDFGFRNETFSSLEVTNQRLLSYNDTFSTISIMPSMTGLMDKIFFFLESTKVFRLEQLQIRHILSFSKPTITNECTRIQIDLLKTGQLQTSLYIYYVWFYKLLTIEGLQKYDGHVATAIALILNIVYYHSSYPTL